MTCVKSAYEVADMMLVEREKAAKRDEREKEEKSLRYGHHWTEG